MDRLGYLQSERFATRMADSSPNSSPPPLPGLADIFLAFSGIALIGFGGVLPWVRRMLVEERRWLTAEEFTDVLSLGQFLPGGNVINVSIVVGDRLRGPLGSIAAIAGLLAAPIAIVIGLGSLYLRYGDNPVIEGALDGMTAAAAGLILSMAVKMATPLFRRDARVPLALSVLTVLAVGVAGLPLFYVLLVLAPLSVLLAWRTG
jgi:chromate transporter